MKFSQQWIQEYVSVLSSTEQVVELLTMAGLEVDSVEEVPGSISPTSLTAATQQDKIIEIDLTPNRGDCLSIRGLARELSVLTKQAFHAPSYPEIPAQGQDSVDIQVLAPEYCPRYVGRIIKNIKSNAQIPSWMQERLSRCDIRSIHPVVDILNYVMIEMGQPMHAFDLSKIEGAISVRLAKAQENITLLDEQKITLKDNTLVIADNTGPLAIAGIMGGLSSGVSEDTQDILLESALFLNSMQAGKARQYGLQTDSSYRFERGIDPTAQVNAIERATQLILEICGGIPCQIQEVTQAAFLPKKEVISLRLPRITKILGINIEQNLAIELLSRIGCECNANGSDALSVLPPQNRYDLNIEVDLIEELARIHGYQNIVTHLPIAALSVPKQNEKRIPEQRIKHALVDLGYLEAINYSFIDSTWQKLLFPDREPIALLNPISQDMDTMRLALLPGLLKTLQYNQRRQQSRVMIFELGNYYYQEKGQSQQRQALAGLCVGMHYADTWRKEQRPVDFFDLKGHINALWQLTANTPLSFEAVDDLLNQKGKSAAILYEGNRIGLVGKLNTHLQKQLDIEGDVYWFECLLEPFLNKQIPKLLRPSKFPEIRRDIAVIVDNNVQSEALTKFVGSMTDELLQSVNIFDEYKGKGIADGRKSIGLGLILQHPSRTLVDDEVNTLMQSIIDGLKKEFAAELRE
ncbi:phenylalanine--tRNA ligase subunit beta [Candidatus Berkiella cookevillensis]|uniref:Phenylalanine--tRNA ligase beta subunit n=1 Tax=Candidatus Berkiella cookevillensis TaxID=437022 RepID=A0A0Q9Y9X9_9GAMM|nr:phenylalanine--tRNA ligase subunit beta [Candidatus Berkiella cookevillensis]MCS5707977.1 phenylalanine--tRNA ligase subunit beta [Candidatus Berkiella cookevillensis]